MVGLGIWGDVIGSHGEEVCNENGRRLLQFSSEHNLIIANTCFPHKKSTCTPGNVEEEGSGHSLITSGQSVVHGICGLREGV